MIFKQSPQNRNEWHKYVFITLADVWFQSQKQHNGVSKRKYLKKKKAWILEEITWLLIEVFFILYHYFVLLLESPFKI